MTTHQMKLTLKPFNKIASGQKIIESRLYDEKRQLLKINDLIEFTCTENSQKITTIIDNLYLYKSFTELFSNFPAELFGGQSKENLLKEIYEFYSKEDENKYGIIGIKIKHIKSD